MAEKYSSGVHAFSRLIKSAGQTWGLAASAAALVVFAIVAATMVEPATEENEPADIALDAPRTSSTPAAVKTTPMAAKKPETPARATTIVATGKPRVAEARAEMAPVAELPDEELGQRPAPITITGCLERSDEAFRLKDTAGADVPKSRSWKSGFLRKSTASIEVVDAANRLKLTEHVGHRVSVTGTLLDREMQVRSLRLVATSCRKAEL